VTILEVAMGVVPPRVQACQLIDLGRGAKLDITPRYVDRHALHSAGSKEMKASCSPGSSALCETKVAFSWSRDWGKTRKIRSLTPFDL
jgi:hypothetical protein